MDSRKYGRTYHFPFSPGTSSDDRIQYDYWQYLCQMESVLLTEKLDGENNCLNRYGVFARSHAAPSVTPWTAHLRERWQRMRHDLGDLELFGENIYAIHSIQYRHIEHYYYVFAARYKDTWLSWEEVCFYATAFDLPTVPVLAQIVPPEKEEVFQKVVLDIVVSPGTFGTEDVLTGNPCTMEGLVCRNVAGYPVDDLGINVFKYVRKGHVKTDEHWIRNWKRARLWFEQKNRDHETGME